MTKNPRASIVRSLVRYVILPRELSAFETNYLGHMNRVGLVFFALHVPVMVAIAWLNGTGPGLALALSTMVVVGPAIAYFALTNPRTVSVTYGVAAMFMGGVLVHVGQGPMQIEMHFYFFALLAMLAVFGNPMVIVVAAITVALHHLALWFLIPRSIFNYDAPVWVVAVHAAFVVLEAVAGCFIARSFFDNVIGLEKIVQARVAELDARNRDMRLVLDHVSQGLLTLDRRGVPSAERSEVFDRWFPPSEDPTATLFDLFGQASPAFAERSRVAWEEVSAAVMPLTLTLDQMPRAFAADDRRYSVSYTPIGEGDSPERFLVVVTDVSAEASRAVAERERLETMELFERLLADRAAVESFFEEGSALADAIGSGQASDLPTLQRMLHTLKGNSAVFGLLNLSALCHDLETWVAEERRAPPTEVLAPFREHWSGLVARVERLLGTTRDTIRVEEADYEALEASARRGGGNGALLTMIQALKLEPTQRRLEHFAEQARRVAGRLEKDVRVEVDGHDLRIDPRYWTGFWSAFIHAVRNAVDHGVDGAAERQAQGKPALGTIRLRSHVRGDRFVIEISDDGRGIDWGRVAEKALELGLPAATESDLRKALFRDGVSTAAQVTEISGRGLGMGALAAATEALGGNLEIESTLGRGTTLRMVFPKAAMLAGHRGDAHASSTAATVVQTVLPEEQDSHAYPH